VIGVQNLKSLSSCLKTNKSTKLITEIHNYITNQSPTTLLLSVYLYNPSNTTKENTLSRVRLHITSIHSSIPGRSKRFFSCAKHLDWLEDLPSFQMNGHWATHLHIMPWLRMTGVIPPLPHMPSWCAQRHYFYRYL
jgi:hypothetical protein